MRITRVGNDNLIAVSRSALCQRIGVATLIKPMIIAGNKADKRFKGAIDNVIVRKITKK